MALDREELQRFVDAEDAEMKRGRSHAWHNPHRGKVCDRLGCPWCDGGLETCDVCGAFEGATPTECPRKRLTADESDLIYAGLLDYRQGAWQLRPARWIEDQHAFGSTPTRYPDALRLVGLPDLQPEIQDAALGHHAELDNGLSTCLPDCPACELAHDIAARLFAERETARKAHR